VLGSNKSIIVDLDKLREAITIQDKQVEERPAKPEEEKVALPTINTDDITEEQYLEKAVELIGPIVKTKNKTLSKESFIKIFKYTGDFAKLKSKEMKAKSQENRCVYFAKDSKKYLEALKQTVSDEEGAYEKSSQAMFERLSISPEFFEKSQ
jgi:hypothetical protein